MAEVNFKDTKIDYVNCVYLLSRGLANKEQQIKAYEYLTGKIVFPSITPRKIAKYERIGSLCAIILEYEEIKDIDAEPPYHWDSRTPVYKSIAEAEGMTVSAVKKNHDRFLKLKESKRQELIEIHKRLFSVGLWHSPLD